MAAEMALEARERKKEERQQKRSERGERKTLSKEEEIQRDLERHQREIERENAKSRAALDAAVGSAPVAGGATVGAGLVGAAKGVTNGKLRLFLLIIMAFHLFDLFSGYNRLGGNSVWWALIYLLFAVVIAPLFMDEGGGYLHSLLSKKTFAYIGVSVVSWILPILIDRFLPAVMQENVWFLFILILSPPWLIFLMFSGAQDTLINKIRKIWVFIWVLLALILLFRTVAEWNAPAQLQGQFGFNPMEVLKDVWENVKMSSKKTFERITGVPTSFGAFVNRNLNDSIGRSYSGQVDQYSSSELGVQFTQLRTYQREFRPGDEIIVWADIQGESFNEEIDLNLRCYAIGNDKRVFNGTVRTQATDNANVKIKMREKISASCTFPGLPKGYYEVVFNGIFAFETWAYIQYYFAPDELVKNMWQQDLNPAREAGIDERPVAVFTSGPINLGLASEYDQPIPVEPFPAGDLTPDRTLPPFGASVINQWTEGEVLSVRQITLMVPDPFLLKDCDRAPRTGTRENPTGQGRADMPGYTEYLFGNIGTGVGGTERANSGFESVTCFLGFREPKSASAEQVVGGYDLVMKTFTAKTNYLYMIRDSIQVKVDDIYQY